VRPLFPNAVLITTSIVTTNMPYEQLFEGVTIAHLPEALLDNGWVRLVRASDNRLLTAIRPPSHAGGPMIIHGAFTQV
jgi:hypothetical protein